MNHAAFIVENTNILSPPLVPELKLHLAHEALPIWQKTEEQLNEIGLPPPFWAFAWAGGQALSRYILDNPEVVKGKTVIDMASGSGMVAIAAMLAGATSVLAADIDQFSIAAIELNMCLNKCESAKFKIKSENLLTASPPDIDVILVGDLFYEKGVAEHCMTWLRQSLATILIGDPGRSYLPKNELIKIAEYSVPVSRDLEDAEIKKTAVWRLA